MSTIIHFDKYGTGDVLREWINTKIRFRVHTLGLWSSMKNRPVVNPDTNKPVVDWTIRKWTDHRGYGDRASEREMQVQTGLKHDYLIVEIHGAQAITQEVAREIRDILARFVQHDWNDAIREHFTRTGEVIRA